MTSRVPAYRPTGSPLHRTRPGVAAAFALAPCVAALTTDHPAVLAAALACVIVTGTAARVGSELRRAARFAVPLAVLVAAINPLVSREGLTVLVRGPRVPLYEALDVTLEATVYGAVAGFRVLVVVLAFAVLTAAVDPDDMLRGLRGIAPRSALTASLATRMVPLLARDAERLAEAYSLRASPLRAGRLRRSAVLARALAAGGLERAMDTAAALELRGYGLAAGRSGRRRAPWSTDDIAFALAAAALAAVGLAAPLADVAGFEPYPLVRAEWGTPEAAITVLMPALAAAPFALAARRLVALRPGGAHA